jgi:RHS repeat-associated protein
VPAVSVALAASSDGAGGNTWAYYALGSRRAAAVHDQHTRPQHWAIAQDGAQTRYLWCGDSICQARDAGDAVTKRYFPQGQFNVAGAKKLYAAIDQVGTVRDVLDAATGAKLASFEFDAFGKSTGASGAADIDFRYAGLLNFAPAGLHLATYRAYDPASARWLSRDPIRERGGINLYSYVDGDPLNYIDPTGLEPFGDCVANNRWDWGQLGSSGSEGMTTTGIAVTTGNLANTAGNVLAGQTGVGAGVASHSTSWAHRVGSS